MSIRALIVDDEDLARERLLQFCAEEPDLELVGQCANGTEAVAAIGSQSPDLVFLDVQMPEKDGFSVLAEIPPEKMPAIIFVTAYDQFALQAFEVHAVDYILKPFDRERFRKALHRAREQIQRRAGGELDHRLHKLLASLQVGAPSLNRLAIKSSGGVVFLKIDELDWIQAADNYVELHAGPNTYMHRETLTALEERLPSSKFLRISRSAIVNIDRIKELQPLSHGDYAVVLACGTRVTLSRNYRDALQQLL